MQTITGYQKWYESLQEIEAELGGLTTAADETILMGDNHLSSESDVAAPEDPYE